MATEPLALTTISPVGSSEFETAGGPIGLSASFLNEAGTNVPPQAVAADLVNLDAGDPSYVNQAVDAMLASLGE